MQIQVSRANPLRLEVDALVVPATETERLPRALRPLDQALDGQIDAYWQSGQFGGKAAELVRFPSRGRIPAASVILLGLGKAREIDAETLCAAAGRGVKALRKARLASAAVLVPGLRRVAPDAAGQAWSEGAVLGHYRFDRYKTLDEAPPALERMDLVVDPRHAGAYRRGVRAGAAIAESTCLARDLSNEPGGVATPEYLAGEARRIARETGLNATIFAERELRRAKMGGILAVGRGSANPPRLIVLEHGRPAAPRRRRPTIALVGKGITFDSGGISIKPAASMDEMKHDMSGAAAVLGAMRAIALLKLPLHVVGLVPAAQNMPDGNAYLPGDVVTASNGKTIEVLNTDAEGRVVLADALHHANSFEPDAIIDLATLTGACIVALGHECAAVIGNDDALIRKLQTAGERVHERLWQLPLWEEHRKQIRGTVGDIKNASGRPAGTITAAAFLSHFVDDTPWAHLDIAGVAWRGKPGKYGVEGATGFGVRLLLELLRNWK
ncbi:MAG: leucyl aminopeptidase [Proteobacteria bacterium]|nr:leucyl aminopeptidase [Pseudomonadota bacterium]